MAMTKFAIAALGALAVGTAAMPAMAYDQYVGEIKAFGTTFCPHGWLPAAGQLLQINQNVTLYHFLGTRFGGDGRTTFALPHLPPLETIGHPAHVIQCIATTGIFPTK